MPTPPCSWIFGVPDTMACASTEFKNCCESESHDSMIQDNSDDAGWNAALLGE